MRSQRSERNEASNKGNNQHGELDDLLQLSKEPIGKRASRTCSGGTAHVSREKLRRSLEEICTWTVGNELGTGDLKAPGPQSRKAICINGGLARTLVAGSLILENTVYLEEACKYLDRRELILRFFTSIAVRQQ